MDNVSWDRHAGANALITFIRNGPFDDAFANVLFEAVRAEITREFFGSRQIPITALIDHLHRPNGAATPHAARTLYKVWVSIRKLQASQFDGFRDHINSIVLRIGEQKLSNVWHVRSELVFREFGATYDRPVEALPRLEKMSV